MSLHSFNTAHLFLGRRSEQNPILSSRDAGINRTFNYKGEEYTLLVSKTLTIGAALTLIGTGSVLALYLAGVIGAPTAATTATTLSLPIAAPPIRQEDIPQVAAQQQPQQNLGRHIRGGEREEGVNLNGHGQIAPNNVVVLRNGGVHFPVGRGGGRGIHLQGAGAGIRLHPANAQIPGQQGQAGAPQDPALDGGQVP